MKASDLFVMAATVVVLSASPLAGAGQLEDAAAAYSNQDYAKALKIWRPLAAKGNPEAQNRLGMAYYRGKGVEQDDKMAIKWFRQAAQHGYAKAQINLATAYNEGRGVSRDLAEAAKWYRKAADQGNALAQNNLAVMYSKGEGVPKDAVQALMWYDLSIAGGNEAASQNRERFVRKATQEQVQEAQRLAKAWKPKAKS